MSDPPNRDECPSPEELLDVVEGTGEGDGSDLVLEHLSRCRACRDDAALALALVDSAREEERGGRPASGSPRGGLGPWGLAASMVLAIGGGGVIWWGVATDRSPDRGEPPRLAAPAVACPGGGELDLRWAEWTGARDYRVEVFLLDGTTLAERIVVGPAARVPVALPDGARPAEVRVLVEARLDDGEVVRAAPAALPGDCPLGG
jgi:hypothetical protein